MKTKKNIVEVSETVVPYISNEIRVFSSFEEADEADAMENAAISPIDHLRFTTQLIKRVFSDVIGQKNDFTIYFK